MPSGAPLRGSDVWELKSRRKQQKHSIVNVCVVEIPKLAPECVIRSRIASNFALGNNEIKTGSFFLYLGRKRKTIARMLETIFNPVLSV